MTRGRKLLLGLLIAVLLLLLLTVGAFYWRARHALPDYDAELRLAGLREPVRVLRDARAVPHLYAANLEDLAFAQGYLQASERLWQMDVIRRDARGQLAEVFGAAAIDLDKDNRRLGLGLTADRAFEQLQGDERRGLEAFARGVNAYIGERAGHPFLAGLPIEFALLHYRPAPWRPSDSLAIGMRMFKLLYTQWPSELARMRVEARVGPERAADLYVTRSDFDHPLAEPLPGPERPRRPRVFVAEDACRHSLAEILEARPVPALVENLGASIGVGGDERSYGASNNWVAAGARTASGAAMLADDMHLPYTVPPIWFLNHLKSPEVDVIGFSLPGLPWVIVGHNGRLAWGFTNMMVDNQDLFLERFDPQDPTRYQTPTGWQTVERRVERIRVRGAPEVPLEILSTRHGPIVHDDGAAKYSLAWTALEPGAVSFPFLAINRASSREELLAAFALYGGPPQNVVYADAEGHIGYHGAGRVPVRRRGHGQVPVPGDSGAFDWVGALPFERLPQATNPASGVLATANNRVVSDDYPDYISERWVGYGRVARIYQLLEQERKFTPEDFLRIQGDIVSLPDRFLAAQLRAAGSSLAQHPPDRAQALAALEEWDGAMRADAAAPLIVTATRTSLLKHLLRSHLGDDWKAYSWFMSTVFVENVLKQRPARWLPDDVESYDALLLAALDDAVAEIRRDAPTGSLRRLRWGDRQRSLFAHPFADRIPVLRRWFSTGGDQQSGGANSPKQTYRASGVSQRFVVDFADLDAALMNVTLGQSGHPASPHYRDQYRAWLEIRSFPAPFSDAAVRAAARHRQTLVPR
jgi:penicillin amidase